MSFVVSGLNLQQIIDDSCGIVDSSSPDFWIMVAALKVHAFITILLICVIELT